MRKIKVSIVLIAYNHEKYVEDALKGILLQKTAFDIEVVVGDDASSDGTLSIIENFMKDTRCDCNIIARKENVGVAENFLSTIAQCRGEYIALLEGDDYWTDPNKLQEQVDFLDSHPEYSMCFHNGVRMNEQGTITGPTCAKNQKATTNITDILQKNYIPTHSVLFRKNNIRCLPLWIRNILFIDWSLHVLNAEAGLTYYIDKKMGVYRTHSAGLSAVRDNPKRGVYNCTELVSIMNKMNEFLIFKYDRYVRCGIARHYFEMAIHQKRCGMKLASVRSVFKGMRTAPRPSLIVRGVVTLLYAYLLN